MGVNVTVPHKEAAFSLSNRNDALAMASGAANLLVFTDTGIEGRNTDAMGLMESLRESLGALNGKSVVLLGAGGAARGRDLGFGNAGRGEDPPAQPRYPSRQDPRRVIVCAGQGARHSQIARRLEQRGRRRSPGGQFHQRRLWAAIRPLDIDLGALPKGAAVCDIVYNPLENRPAERCGGTRAQDHRTASAC